MRAIRLEDESQVGAARRAAVTQSQNLGFGVESSGRVAIVATELATNVLKHGGGGELLIASFDDGAGGGIECIALDRGAGMADIATSMRDGHSTAGSAGTGLGAIRRQSNQFDIYSRPQQGTAVLARVNREAKAASIGAAPDLGVVNLAMHGEEVCGDAWSVLRDADGMTLLVADGLGHGPMAAAAAHAAVQSFEQAAQRPSAGLIALLHQALRPTRGAAVSIARIDDRGEVDFIGVGNVLGAIVDARGARRMVCHNGTLGHSLKTARVFNYPIEGATLVVMASDGLSSGWSFDQYPGLARHHPSLIAAVLYRDFNRGHDDVTVMIARRDAS